jgi:hypothetical protein
MHDIASLIGQFLSTQRENAKSRASHALMRK